MRVEITGRYALFSRPEMRAERFSYEVPTPSAINGILKCIYWKPEMQYHINKIYVLNRPRFSSVTTNSLIRKGSLKPGGKCEYGSHDTTPRTMQVLKDVRYVVDFTISATGTATSEDDSTEKHVAIFTRRASRGQNFREPTLGVKEFPCEVRLMPDDEKIPFSENHGEKKLGRMLHHVDLSGDTPVPVFYNPVMRDGVIDVNESLEGYISEGWLFQNLVGYYDRMKDRYDLPVFGYSNAKVHYEAVLNEEGELKAFHPLLVTEKGKVAPVIMSVPDAAIRTSNDAPNFLWDNESYVLGMGKSGDIRKELFENKIKAVMENTDLKEIKAVLSFLTEYTYEDYADMIEPYLTTSKGEKTLGGNIVFRIDGEDEFIHNLPAVKEKWEDYFYANLTGKKGRCIITGEEDYITDIHPLIKGVAGSSGMAKLVSIDGEATAFEYRNLKGMDNSPFGRKTTHKYSVVLNWLLSNLDHKVDVKKESFIFWTENDNEALLENLQKVLGRPFANEHPEDEIPVGEKFYIAGLKASTKGRLYVAHYQDFIYGQSKEILQEFLARISSCYEDSKIKPCFEMMERWEETLGYGENNKNRAYLLGGLLACIEKAQKDAVTSTRNAGTQTISDKYIRRASETPAAVFPELLRMAQIYTNKVDYGMKRRIADLLSLLNQLSEPFPTRLVGSEKCEFFSGYYITNSELYVKREKKEETDNE